MADEESQQAHPAPRRRGRRGRPPGSKNRVTTTRTKRAAGGELVAQLNHMVAELISENRKLRRQLTKLSERGASTATKTVERGLRTISRRVQKALDGAPKTRKRRTATNGRRKSTGTRRRRTTS